VATPKQFRRRGRWSLIIGTLLAALTVGAVMAFASSSTVTNNIPLNNDTAGAASGCPTGGSYWHFVITPNSGGAAFVTFHLNLGDATTYNTSSFVPNGSQTDNVFVLVPAGKTLTDLDKGGSSADITGTATKFTLSGVCAGKSKPSIETDPGDGGKVGVTLNDTATLSGGTSPTGTITFTLYDPAHSDCSGSGVYTDVVTVNGNDTYDTATQGNNSGGYVSIVHGTYQWTADYSGDVNNEPASSGCGEEAFVTETAASNVLTEVRNTADEDVTSTHVPLGSVVHDHAKVTAPGSPNTPEGTVDFTFYNGTADKPCSGNPVSSQLGVALVNGEADSDATDPLGPGSYGYLVHYDSSNLEAWTDGDGTCEPFIVDQGQLTADTTLHAPNHDVIANDTELNLGSKVHDTAQISGAVDGFDPTGAVTFTYFTNGTCTPDGTDAPNIGADESTGDPRTADTTALAPGSYSFQAAVAGDGNYLGDTSGCEPFTVKKGQLTADTILHAPNHSVIAINTELNLGSKVHDTAQITGAVEGFNPSGAVTFTYFTNGDCTEGTGTDAPNIGADESTGDPRTANTAALAPGSYSFQAAVAGDGNYEGDTSGCEPFTVKKGNLTIGTLIHDSADNVVTFVPVNGIVHDTAQLTGATAGFTPTAGNVSFVFFTTIDCTGPSVSKANIGPDAKTGDPRSENVGPLASGAYSFQASFANDANYNDAGPSGCEPLSVRTFGKTMGFWGNKNGQARIPANFTYTLGENSATTCYVSVTKAKTVTIFPNTKNGVSILTNCTTVASRDPGINTESLNVLLAQALALKLNIDLVSGFNGQPIGALGVTLPTVFPAGWSLTATSTVQQALDYANYLIAQSKLGGVVITQTMIGQLNTTLGQINAEA
jgi:uncharacterized protein (DUF2141 family)